MTIRTRPAAAALAAAVSVATLTAARGQTATTQPSQTVTTATTTFAGPAGPMKMFVTATGNADVRLDARTGRTERAAYLGVSASAVTDATLRDQLKLPAGVGLAVDLVVPDSPAAAAGVQVHDVLTKVDDQWAIDPPQLGVLVRLHHAGDTVTLALVRHGQPTTVTAKLTDKETFIPDVVWAPVPTDAATRVEYANGYAPLLTYAAVAASSRPSGLPALSALAAVGDTDADVLIREGGRTITIRSTGTAKQQLTVTDGTGKTTFAGPIDTPEQRRALPADVAAVLSKYKAQIDPADGTGPGVRRRVVILHADR